MGKRRKKKNAPEIRFSKGVIYKQAHGQAVSADQNLFDCFMKYILIVCGCVGVLLSVADSFSISVRMEPAIGAVLLWSLFFLILFGGKKRKRYAAYIVTGAVLLFLVLAFTDILDGIRYLYTRVASCYASYYGMTLRLADVSEITDAQILCGLAFLMIPVAWGLARAMGIRTNLIWATLALFPVVALELLCGRMPSPLPLFLILGTYLITICLCLTAFCGVKRRMSEEASVEEKENACLDCVPDNASVIGVRGTAICVMALLLLVSGYLGYGLFYKGVESVFSPIREAVYSSSVKELLDSFRNHYSSGGINGGNLNGTGEIRFDGSAHLYVTFEGTAPRSFTYLKGYVGNVYDGKQWTDFPDAVYESQAWEDLQAFGEDSLIGYHYRLIQFLKEQYADAGNVGRDYTYLSRDMLGNLYSTMVMITRADSQARKEKYVTVPYYAYITGEDGTIINGSYLERKSSEETFNAYDLYYWEGDSFFSDLRKLRSLLQIEDLRFNSSQAQEEWDALRELERRYRQFVYENYLEVSDRVPRLQEEYGNRQIDGAQEAIRFVQEELAENAVYTLKPGACPLGKDYIEYFFYENKKGYCTHFASAAVELFRILGYPARFVQGYLVAPGEAGESIEVDDSCAHAWVEVYMDGFGWIPVEVTPGLNGEAGGYTSAVNDALTGGELPPASLPTTGQTEEENTSDVSAEASTEETAEGSGESEAVSSEEATNQTHTEENSTGEETEATDKTVQGRPEASQKDPAATVSSGSGGSGTGAASGGEGTGGVPGNASGDGQTGKPGLPLWAVRILQSLAAVALVIGLAALLAGVHRRTYLAARSQRFRHRNFRQGILNIYAALCAMTEKYGQAINEYSTPEHLAKAYPVLSGDFWEIVQKTVVETAYSTHEVTAEDRDRVLYAYRMAARFLCGNLDWKRRLLFRYWDCYR